MAEPIVREVAQQLAQLREKEDAIAQARRGNCPDAAFVVEVLERLRALLLEQTPTERLPFDLEVVHGQVVGLIGTEAAARLLEHLPRLRELLARDVQAAFEQDPAANAYAEIIASYPSVRAISSHRIAHEFYLAGHPVIARIMAEHAHGETGIDIHPGARIGSDFFIDHGTGVVIGETCEIGDRVKLYHGVTLGAFSNKEGRSDHDKKRHPTIENEVTIYPNATILGGDTRIGRGAVIGGNAWVTRSVEPHTRVTLEPPRLEMRAPEQYEI